jgi:hypothetical protein
LKSWWTEWKVENRVSGTEDKVEELDQTVRSWENAKKIWIEHAGYLEHHEKTKPMNHGCRRRGDTN